MKLFEVQLVLVSFCLIETEYLWVVLFQEGDESALFQGCIDSVDVPAPNISFAFREFLRHRRYFSESARARKVHLSRRLLFHFVPEKGG